MMGGFLLIIDSERALIQATSIGLIWERSQAFQRAWRVVQKLQGVVQLFARGWCNMLHPHKLGEGICSCRGSGDIRERTAEVERIVEEVATWAEVPPGKRVLGPGEEQAWQAGVWSFRDETLRRLREEE
jgi:hypothetical protein